MRRDKRGLYDDEENYKVILWIAGGILIIAIISFFVIYGIYNDKMESIEIGTVNQETSKIDISNTVTNSTVVSSSIGKNVNELKNENIENLISNNIKNNVNNEVVAEFNNDKNTLNNVETNTANIKTPTVNKNTNENKAKENVEKENLAEDEKEPVFQNPIENGEILREFANESLVYSETLEEWITHLGIDIKAPKTTVVKAAEAGTVESIKSDPRYGLTIIVKHAKGYKTVYSNLLTTEFVNIGDKVEKGQSLGTVGNSAAFEIADEPHLHFEIIIDDKKVDPTLYIK